MPSVVLLRVRYACIFLLSLVLVVAADPAVAETVSNASSIVQASPEIQRHIDEMLERSPTFREQYQRVLETPHVIITARIQPAALGSGSFRARSTIRRYASGLLIVSMEIAPGSNQAQWIAHEFEHVIEQLEGVDVREHASRGTDDSWYSGDHAIETLRAVRAGRRVQEEVRRSDSRQDKLVVGGQ